MSSAAGRGIVEVRPATFQLVVKCPQVTFEDAMIQSVRLSTPSEQFSKALSQDAADSSFPAKVPTATEPSGDGVINLSNGSGNVPNALVVAPFGVGGDNDTFSVRVIGWRKVGYAPSESIWVPVVLVELACTMSTVTGVSGRLVTDSHRFVDTITLVSGNDDISVDIVSPTGNVLAHAVVDLKGFQKVEFTFDSTAAGTTGMNCLVAAI